MSDKSPAVDDEARRATFIAFAEALEQWERLEDEFVLLYGNLGWSPDYGETWDVFVSARGFQEQRKMVADLALHALGRDGSKRVGLLLDGLERLSKKRNGMVHGLWRVVSPLSDADEGRRTLRRDRRHPRYPGGFMPTSDKERDDLRARSLIFYIEDLQSVRDEFASFRNLVMREREQIIRLIAPKVRRL